MGGGYEGGEMDALSSVRLVVVRRSARGHPTQGMGGYSGFCETEKRTRVQREEKEEERERRTPPHPHKTQITPQEGGIFFGADTKMPLFCGLFDDLLRVVSQNEINRSIDQ